MKKNNTDRKRLSTLSKVFLTLVLTVFTLSLVGTGLFFAVLYLGGEQPDLALLENACSKLTIYNKEDKPIKDESETEYADISQIPVLLKNALLR